MEIRGFLKELASQPWLANSRNRRWWPKYVFHHTDVRNAASALNGGRLLSRQRARELGLLTVDSASPGVIGHTGAWVQSCARLYFRPRTPTQYRQEGIRPKQSVYEEKAHCPVPVFFLFDSADVLTRTGSSFSNGNLGAGAAVGNTVAFLRELDFQTIYHSGWFEPEDRESIIFSRHAEGVVPGELDLAVLKQVVTRTTAERETLISLLASNAIRHWESRILTDDTSLGLFERSWNFVEHASLSDGKAVINFSPDSKANGPFELKVHVTDLGTNRRLVYRKDDFYCTPQLELTIAEGRVSSYLLSLTLDGNLAYQGEHFADLPF